MLSVMIKPVSSRCNMACSYCFYRDEAMNRSVFDHGLMTPEVLSRAVRTFLETGDPEVSFLFQGGEPSLAGNEFYEQVLSLQNKYKTPGQTIYNSIQTNGLFLDSSFADALSRLGFLTGLSLDGPPGIHDRWRRACGAGTCRTDTCGTDTCGTDTCGAGTCRQVLGSLSLLQKLRIPYSVLTVVTASSVGHAAEIYDFLKSRGVTRQQYIPCMDPLGNEAGRTPYSLSADGYARFLRELFDAWFQDLLKGRDVYIRYFDNLILMARGQKPESCDLYGRCSVQYVVESDGSVYPCDFYSTDPYLLGNLCANSLGELDEARLRLGFLADAAPLPGECPACRWFFLCRGGCKRDRQREGAFAKSRYCSSYLAFFPYAWERIAILAGLS